MALKTYVLLPHTEPNAAVYRQINAHQRTRLNKRILDHAYLQIAFQDREQKRRVIRLRKSMTSKIFLDEQIADKIEANIPHTQRDKDAVRFHFGVLQTNDLTTQEFLETSPQFDENWKPKKKVNGKWVDCDAKDPDARVCICEDIMQPLYTLLDETKDTKERNKEFKKRVAAANRVNDLSLKEAQDLLIKLNGSFFEPPKVSPEKDTELALQECQNMLVEYLDELDEAGLDRFNTAQDSIDDKITLLIGNAIMGGILSFDKVADQVTRTKDGRDMKVFMVPDEYGPDQRLLMFAEFLRSEKGKAVYDDIEEQVAEADKKSKTTTKSK